MRRWRFVVNVVTWQLIEEVVGIDVTGEGPVDGSVVRAGRTGPGLSR